MTRESLLSFCESLAGTVLDRPFAGDFETTIARHGTSRKWYAALMEREGHSFVNLKCEPMKGSLLRDAFFGITPGYHMNKQHWISVQLVSDVPDSLIEQLIEASYHLTRSGSGKRKQRLKDSLDAE